MRVKEIEVIWLDVPLTELSGRAMERAYNGWRIIEIVRVTTDNGLVGLGESQPNYVGTEITPAIRARVLGGNPFDMMWDDSISTGLQMALFDVAGKAAGAPVYRLLGQKVRDWAPIAWWDMDMPPEDFAREAQEAAAQGHTSFKQKARPWFDVYEQARLSAAATPAYFQLEFDFNELLGDAGTAGRVLAELDQCSKITLYESPLPHSDYEGYRKIRDYTRRRLAVHYAQPVIAPHRPAYYDSFVLDQFGVSALMRRAHWCQETNMPFWLQLCGTGITTTWALHLGAVLTHAQIPLVSCMNIYADQLITQPIVVKGGYARVPESPGLGIEFDEAALKWRTATPRKANVEAIYTFVRANGDKTWYAGENGPHGYWEDFRHGNQPLYEHGVRMERWDNDGSPEWRELAGRLKAGPLRGSAWQ